MQHTGSVGPFLGNRFRAVVQLGAVAWHDLVQFFLPGRACYLVLEHFLQHGQHDRSRGGRAWRCTQQAGDGVVGRADHFGTELQHAALLFVTLDDLHALAGLPQAPVGLLGVREVLLQRLETVIIRQHQLAGEVLDQWVFTNTDFGHRPDVVGGGAGQQVQVRAFFQELGREGGEWAKQNHTLAIQHAGVQVRNRHRWRTYRSLTVGLGQVLLGDGRVLGHQERTTDWEACVFLAFRNARLLQQVQGTAAGADEHELGVGFSLGAVFEVFVAHAPRTVGVLSDVLHFARQLQVKLRRGLQVSDELAGDLAEVYVGADRAPGGRDFLARVTPFHHQRNPLGDLRRVFGVLHAGEQRAGLQGFVAFFQELDVVIAPHKAHVRSGVDERTRVLQHALLNLPGPELTGDLERFVDLDRFRDLNVAVLVFRGVVQLSQGRVTGTGVVPAVGAFFGHAIEALDHLHRPIRFQLIEPDTQGCTHDAAADQQHIDFLCLFRVNGRDPHRQSQPQQGSVYFFKHQ
ncbi:hypothetical protein PFLmoz3_03528 [Pseudomonas fluorescens]|uniref:Uncharacterized protein n=1 Tax=Pseudomonas fluorescens TaxID=294 RepID=A0A109LG47_PSEFL|nr:hypothetical protein PFLmoz3_03528 [Pseudomonas fluorescens]